MRPCKDCNKAHEMVLASMEYVKVLGFRIRKTEGISETWKKAAQTHAEECVKLREQLHHLRTAAESGMNTIEALKKERDNLWQREGIEKQRRINVEAQLSDTLADLGALLGVDGGARSITAAIEKVKERNVELSAERERMKAELAVVRDERDTLRIVRDGLLTQVQDMRAEMERLQMEVAALKSQTPKPCDQPVTVKREPKVGDTVRLVMIPSRDDVSPELRKVLEWPWIERWGTLNQTALAVEPAYQLDGTLSVCLSTNVYARWPLSCVEVVTEATHDTEAGKAAAAAAVKTEPVADEIKVGDVVEVFQSTASCTFKTDIGTRGTVLQLDDSCVDTAPLDGFLAPKYNHVALCDVRKVTT